MKKAILIILTFIVLSGFFRLQSSMSMKTSSDGDFCSIETLYYDDHIDVTGKTVEIIDAGVSNDNSSVIELRGNYLVASGIGIAKVKINGEIYGITVNKAKINLIMIMGQSNAGNHFQNATSDVTCPIGTAYWWNASDADPVPYTDASMGFHSPLLAELYAQSVADGEPQKNVMIWEEGRTREVL